MLSLWRDGGRSIDGQECSRSGSLVIDALFMSIHVGERNSPEMVEIHSRYRSLALVPDNDLIETESGLLQVVAAFLMSW